MIEGSLSRRYSKALYELAREDEREESVGLEIEAFLEAYSGSGSELPRVLNNPAFALDGRKKILIEVARSLHLTPLSEHFLLLLLERDRLSFLPAIVTGYRHLLNAAKGRVEAKIVSAAPLGSGVVEQLRDSLRRLSGKDVVVREENDPELIGGLVIELEGKVYDGSVRTQVEKMAQRSARGY
jgi:F-type H+-transporting ATPase subunit delta